MNNWSRLSSPRPSHPVPSSSHHQTLLSKSIFEHATSFAQLASIAVISSSILNSSLAPNLARNLTIDDEALRFFSTVFDPSETSPCQTLQFVPALSCRGTVLQSVVGELKKTKYFRKSIAALTIDSPVGLKATLEIPTHQNEKDNNTDFFCCYSALETITLIDWTVREEDVEFLKSKTVFPRLRSLILQRPHLTNELLSFAEANDESKTTTTTTPKKRSLPELFSDLGNVISLLSYPIHVATGAYTDWLGLILPRLENVEELMLDQSNFGDDAVKNIIATSMPRLRTLKLHGSNLTDDALVLQGEDQNTQDDDNNNKNKKNNASLNFFPSLTEISLSGFPLTGEGGLRSICVNVPRLKSLSIDRYGGTEQEHAELFQHGFKHLASNLKMLESLHVRSDCYFLDENVLRNIVACSTLTDVSLYCACEPDGKSLSLFGQLPSLTSLSVTAIQSSRLLNAQNNTTASASKNKNLCYYDFPHQNLKSLQLYSFSSMNFSSFPSSFPQLTTLRLPGCSLFDDTALARIVAMSPNIRHLNVADTAVGDAGVVAIATHLDHLRVLEAGGCWHVTDKGLATLFNWKDTNAPCCTLSVLDISRCSFTDRFIRSCIPKFHRVARLGLRIRKPEDHHLSYKTIEEIKKAHPKMWVDHDLMSDEEKGLSRGAIQRNNNNESSSKCVIA